MENKLWRDEDRKKMGKKKNERGSGEVEENEMRNESATRCLAVCGIMVGGIES